MKKSNPSNESEKKKKYARKEVIEKKKNPESQDFFDAIMRGIKEDFKDVIVPTGANDTLIEVADWITMPQPIQQLIGVPGLPCGLVTMVYGPTDSGKTTFANEAIRSTLDSGGSVLFLKTEEKYSLKRASAQGIDTTRMAILTPKTVEQVGDVIETFSNRIMVEKKKKKSGRSLVVWDSLAATPCAAEVEVNRKEFSMDAAKALRGMFRRIHSGIKDANIAFLIVNQVYDNMAMFGEKTTPYGGKGAMYHSAILLKFAKLGRIRPPGKSSKAGDDFCGTRSQIEVVKNHLGQPFKKIEVEIDWRGFVIGRKPEYAPEEFTTDERDAELHEKEEERIEFAD